ncbi:putative lipid II flippase FtsW [soil metagenome]
MRLRLPRTTSYDLQLLAVVLALLAIGLAMVYSASGIRALDTLEEPRYFLVQQSVWAALGLVAMAVVSRIDYHRYRAFALPALVASVVLLVVVLVPGVGTSVGGASRWLRIGSFAGIQPAELAKLALIVYLAFWFASKQEGVGRAPVTAAFLVIVGAACGLVVAEPDLGTALVIAAIALTMYFVAGARLREFAALAVLAFVVAAALAVAQPYRLQRLLTFVDPWADPRGAGFQSIQALYGLALGGLFGEGLGAGKEKFGYLPAAYTDSIFAVLGNELGLMGTLTVIVLFFVLAFKGIRIALRAPDASGGLLAAGITAWLAFQAWLNMAVVASLVPMTGITLPFVSYGGSSLCLGLVAVGILLNVGHQGASPAPVPSPSRGRGDRRTRESAARGGGGGTRRKAGRGLPLRGWPPRP